MPNYFAKIEKPKNEEIWAFEKNSPQRNRLQSTITNSLSKLEDHGCVIDGKLRVKSHSIPMHSPHELSRKIGRLHLGELSDFEDAIKSCLQSKSRWESMDWQERLKIFLKAAELIANKYRYEVLAATMIAQSKNVYQAEIDCVCELVDFLRFNAYYVSQIYEVQPSNSPNVNNRLEYRALEGFTFALSPFNFTAIAGNLPTSMAMCGNTVVWKPAETQVYSASLLMKIFKEAGLPDGVINMIVGNGPEIGNVVFSHQEFAGLHFTGSSAVFKSLWKTISSNLDRYRSYPKIVGETGGKDFVLAHHTADPIEVATALVRGAFEYQGQKCSAASRAYISSTIWETTRNKMLEFLNDMKMGTPYDFTNFINAVIDAKAFEKITQYIEYCKSDKDCTVIAGGEYSDKEGYFIQPTIVLTTNPTSKTMVEEIFGPVLTIFVYKDEDFDKTIELVDTTSVYGLTGAFFCSDRAIIQQVSYALRNAAGNFYINDKPTGAVVDQQPFGGARASGTNDKAGSIWNIIRWMSPRTIKENYFPPCDITYPFLED